VEVLVEEVLADAEDEVEEVEAAVPVAVDDAGASASKE
jgi:hypothetical protein